MTQRFILVLFILGFFLKTESFAQRILPFKGEINLLKETSCFTFVPNEKGLIDIRTKKIDTNAHQINFDVSSLKIGSFDVSTVLTSSFEFSGQNDAQPQVLTGQLFSQYTLVNHRPAKELQGQIEVKNDKLYFHSFALGNIVCDGFVQLSVPYNLELSVAFSSIDIADFINFLSKGQSIKAEGLVDGKIYFSGDLTHLQLKGTLESFNGWIDTLEYNNISLNVAGIYPFVYIISSSVAQRDGLSFNLTGSVDLSDTDNLGKQIQALTKEPLIRKEGQNLEWTLKRLHSESDAGTTEIKYLLKEKSPVHGPFDETEDLLGIERRLEF